MKDIFSKVTFGFFMAQLVPGAIIVFSLTFLFKTLFCEVDDSVYLTAQKTFEIWNTSVIRNLIAIILSIGAGMAVHGLNWAVLGFLEQEQKSIFESRWQKQPIIVQILIAPLALMVEFIWFLCGGEGIAKVSITENVPKISKDKMEAFQFLQDFYLHFSQFYAHTGYALFIGFIVVLVFTIDKGLTSYRPGYLAISYLLSAYFFVISRVQFRSLFQAELDILEADTKSRRAAKIQAVHSNRRRK
jgi:hypothetical protein